MTDTSTPGRLGQNFTLTHGEMVADIVSFGAHLRTFRVGARDVVTPFGIDEFPPASSGAVLVPWPNRLEDGRYTWRGGDHRAPINEVDRMTALHGLMQWQHWSGVLIHDACVRLSATLTATPAYPFTLELNIEYLLTAEGLEVTLRATNIGAEDAPYGNGFHPWLSPGPGGLDTAVLSADATTWYPTDERLLPTGIDPLPDHFDFRSPRPVGATTFDDAFGSPTFDADGRSWVRLRGDDGATAEVWMESPFALWQLCSAGPGADGRRPGLAVEPMTCPANAFRSGDHLLTLAPGETHTVRWGARLTRD
ncbi:aldose epimerase [Pseudactinotalea sp. HY160]|uniref:aldose 1-epimerase family protein n=1 Tax=Pseudactinotalea sp. HY160 TaxID=2654490 RepID=UPI00128D87C0|nr:aldose epimerase [Pseudactinotalea sp. HY160]